MDNYHFPPIIFLNSPLYLSVCFDFSFILSFYNVTDFINESVFKFALQFFCCKLVSFHFFFLATLQED